MLNDAYRRLYCNIIIEVENAFKQNKSHTMITVAYELQQLTLDLLNSV